MDPSLLDLDIVDALDTLVRSYTLEERGESQRTARLSERPRRVFEVARRTCEWRLGRCFINHEKEGSGQGELTPLTVSQILLCLKRVRKSVRFWYAQGGGQGYLNFVRQFSGYAGE